VYGQSGDDEDCQRDAVTLHENQCQPRPVTEGIPFLGFLLYPDHRLLKHRKGIAFQRKLAMLRQDYQAAKITFPQLDASVKGWVNHVRFVNTWGLRRSLLAIY
jgi:RNA-directed DNA polymerase